MGAEGGGSDGEEAWARLFPGCDGLFVGQFKHGPSGVQGLPRAGGCCSWPRTVGLRAEFRFWHLAWLVDMAAAL